MPSQFLYLVVLAIEMYCTSSTGDSKGDLNTCHVMYNHISFPETGKEKCDAK